MVEASRSLIPGSSEDAAAGPKNWAEPKRHKPKKSWTELLQETIEAEVLPLLLSANQAGAGAAANTSSYLTQADIESFVSLLLADELEEARTIVDRLIVQSGGREALLQQLLTPAAQYLGTLWEQDLCDFMDVTLGVYRLDQFMKETTYYGGQGTMMQNQHDRRALLLPAPGETHSFGITMVADVFREAGWCVRSGPAVARHKLMRLVRDEWFDVVGLSISSDRWLGSLAACIRAIRVASCNSNLVIMLGGAAIVGHDERTRFLGADTMAIDAYQALEISNLLVSNLAEKQNLHALRQATLT